MLLILVDEITERIKYTFDFILTERSLKYTLITSVDEFESDERGIRLNYSHRQTKGGRIIRPAGLMSEDVVSSPEVARSEYEGMECLSFDGKVDPVASVFYILTRYEEYDQSKRDDFGRFPFRQSVLSRFEWVEKAMCDRWARHLIELLDKDLFLEAVLRSALTKSGHKFIPTFDIDNTYAYKYKTGIRKLLSIARDLFNMDKGRLSERRTVNSGKAKDPYDTYDRIAEVADLYPETKLFWLMASAGEKDRNLSLSNEAHRELIRTMAKRAEIGVHPSFGSFRSEAVIRKEKALLETITGKEVLISRQHFLRFQLPLTYQQLVSAGIRHEYSMGFAESIGFRCGTARKHKWFDLVSNSVTELTIHPFVYMDGSLREYMKLDIDDSKVKIKALYDEVRNCGGDFIFIWHNETIGDYANWTGWSELLDFTLKLSNE